MRASEFLPEVTDPKSVPPKPGDPEFEKSKKSFIEIINKFTKDYTTELNDMKSMAPADYKKLTQNRQAMVSDFQQKLSKTLIARGNNFITDRDFNSIGLNKIKFSSGQKKLKQMPNAAAPATASTNANNQSAQSQTNATAPSIMGIKPDDPRYASMAAALEKQNKKKATGESIEEAVLNLSKNAVILTPTEIDGLATRATQVWYQNRQLKTQNPTLYAKMTGGGGVSSGNSMSSGGVRSYGSGGLAQQNQALADPDVFGVNPQLGNAAFTQAFVNKLDSLSNKSDIEKLLQKIKQKSGIIPTQKTSA
jgi:hypothetical protein